MEWVNRFNSAINYMADVPLSEYLRRRRMSLAAVDLLAGGKCQLSEM